MKKKSNTLPRILFGLVMLLAGSTLTGLTIANEAPIARFGDDVGLALIVAGCIFVFEEIARAFLQEKPVTSSSITSSDITMINTIRRGDDRYHIWAIQTEPQQLIFAGHSVLHRIQFDFNKRKLKPVEEILTRKISEGSQINVLFLDPIWDYIEKIAKTQRQDPNALRTDIATSFGLSKKIWNEVTKIKPGAGEINIRTNRELIQYAYHFVKNTKSTDVELLIGFYFYDKVSTNSPLFEVKNYDVQVHFEEHFRKIFDDAQPLLSYRGGGPSEFNDDYYLKARTELSHHIGQDQVSRLCP